MDGLKNDIIYNGINDYIYNNIKCMLIEKLYNINKSNILLQINGISNKFNININGNNDWCFQFYKTNLSPKQFQTLQNIVVCKSFKYSDEFIVDCILKIGSEYINLYKYIGKIEFYGLIEIKISTKQSKLNFIEYIKILKSI